MWKGRMGEWGEGTASGRVKVRLRGTLRGGERGREKNNGVFRGLVFWILTSQFVCVCVCVRVCLCVGVLYFSLNIMTVF